MFALERSRLMKLSLKIISCLIVFTFCILPVTNAASLEEKRQHVRNITNETLNKLYKVNPSARHYVESAEGYAVFGSWGVKLIFLGGGSGKGMAINNKNDNETFMNMAEMDVGLGLGAKKYKLVFIFETQKALHNFVNTGLELGAQATAAATDSVTGDSVQGAVSILPGVWLYQLTETGLAAELSVKGTKYFKDKELNQ